jgi:hypothetical protein
MCQLAIELKLVVLPEEITEIEVSVYISQFS